MSKATVHRKPLVKKPQDRNSSISERASDDETNRRRPCHQLAQKEKEKQQQQTLTIDDLRKNKNHLGILREILSHKQNVDELTQKSNRSEKNIAKNNTECNGKQQSTKKPRPTSAKTFTPSSILTSNRSTEDNLSVNSADEEFVEDEPVRLSRSNGKYDQQQVMFRSASLYSQPTSKVSFMPHSGRSNDTESNSNASSGQLKRLLDRLSLELHDLESMTGFKPNKTDLSTNTCSSTLAAALITLTGHVKQCTPNSRDKQEINHLKDQLSLVIKTQLDFQQKIENQMTTLQTMMQTVCQLVNNEVISNRKCQACTSRVDRAQADFQTGEPRQNLSSNVQRSYITPKDTNNAMNELLLFARRMNNATPVDANLNHQPPNNLHSSYIETLQASKHLTRPPSSISANEIDPSKPTQERQRVTHESRPSTITPMNVPSPYHMFESSLLNGNSSINMVRNETNELDGHPNLILCASKNETLLEKILQERLRLVQQMAELNKQHNTTQEELANLEEKTRQPREANQQMTEYSTQKYNSNHS